MATVLGAAFMDLLAKLPDVPEDPFHGAQGVIVHQDRWEEIRKSSKECVPVFVEVAGLPVTLSSFMPKSRGFFVNALGQIVGIYDFDTDTAAFWSVKGVITDGNHIRDRVPRFTGD